MRTFLLLILLGVWLPDGAAAETGDAPRWSDPFVDNGRTDDAAVCLPCGPPSELYDGARTTDAPSTMSAAQIRAYALYGYRAYRPHDRDDRHDRRVPREFRAISAESAASRFMRETAHYGEPFYDTTEDRWLGFDKVQHVTFSFLWTLGTQYVAVNKGRFSEAQALPLSIGTSAAIGVSKELYDRHVGRQRFFSYRDLVADGIGILLAAGIILL